MSADLRLVSDRRNLNRRSTPSTNRGKSFHRIYPAKVLRSSTRSRGPQLLPPARLAMTTPGRIDVQVLSRVRMTLRAMRLGKLVRSARIACLPPLAVHAGRDRFQVRRVDAAAMLAREARRTCRVGVVAQVVDLQVAWDGAVLGFPREPVRVFLSATAGDGCASVACLRDHVLPEPAGRQVAEVDGDPVGSGAQLLASGVVTGDVQHRNALDSASPAVRARRDGGGLAAAAVAESGRYGAHGGSSSVGLAERPAPLARSASIVPAGG